MIWSRGDLYGALGLGGSKTNQLGSLQISRKIQFLSFETKNGKVCRFHSLIGSNGFGSDSGPLFYLNFEETDSMGRWF
jgi:hypothetical protein